MTWGFGVRLQENVAAIQCTLGCPSPQNRGLHSTIRLSMHPTIHPPIHYPRASRAIPREPLRLPRVSGIKDFRRRKCTGACREHNFKGGNTSLTLRVVAELRFRMLPWRWPSSESDYRSATMPPMLFNFRWPAGVGVGVTDQRLNVQSACFVSCCAFLVVLSIKC